MDQYHYYYKTVYRAIESGEPCPPAERWTWCPECGAEGWLRVRVIGSRFPVELEFEAPCQHLLAILREHEGDKLAFTKLVFTWDGENQLRRWSIIPMELLGVMGYQFAAESLLIVLGEVNNVWVAISPPTLEQLSEFKLNELDEIVNLVRPRLWVGHWTDQGVVYFRPLIGR